MRGAHMMFAAAAAGAGLTMAIGATVWAIQGADDAAAAAATTTTTTTEASATTTTVHDDDHDHEDTEETAESAETDETEVTTEESAEHEHDDTHGLVIHDTTAGAEATATDEANAAAFAAAVATGAERFTDLDVALAEGYVMTASSAKSPNKVEHYMLRGGTEAVLDPEQPEGLVYWVDGDTAVLLGVVFTEQDEENLEQPGGPLTTWHDHSEMGCPEGMECDELDGEPVKMLHVWLFEGADTFAHDFPQALGDGYERDDLLPFL